MATTKKKPAAATKATPPKKAVARKVAAPKAAILKEDLASFDELVASNIAALTQGLARSTDTADLLTKKVTSMACHILALEAVLSEVVSITGVDLVRVNSRIRARLAVQGDTMTDSDVVVDLAAAIASPMPR